MVNIDQELCIGCRACEEDCVGDVIIVKDGKAEVTKRCIECGHCVALCPVCAVSIPEYDMDDVEEYHPGTFHVNPENMLHAVKFRRSIRRYKPAKIEKDKAGRILDAGRYSATAKNQQGCTFTFVQDGMDETGMGSDAVHCGTVKKRGASVWQGFWIVLFTVEGKSTKG